MLTLRQKNIVELLPKCDILADVGCDHGKIGYAALVTSIAKKVYFIDISRDSLLKAEKLCASKNFNAEFICQDGLGKIQADCAVIAGMGGQEIIEIIKNAEYLPQILVLQPMKNSDILREYVQKQYKIEKDYLFFDKKYYFLMKLSLGKDSLSKMEIKYGKTNIARPTADFQKFLRKELALCEKILSVCADEKAEIKRKEILSLLIKE
ncbi:MAG: class I SAM-dependent methyltransferase [Clostridia bacterium]|nr:class I SAM-dependent methyltransferase [Clostridia bacterium]